MANAIELAKSYVPKLDEVYKLAALTSVLDSDGAELKEGANAGEFIIPKMSMDGLGAYDRNNGYAQGSVTMENETVKANFDRGRKFVVDVADDLETAGLAFGKLSAEFIRLLRRGRCNQEGRDPCGRPCRYQGNQRRMLCHG